MKQILFFTLWLASLSALAQFPVNVLTAPGNQTITVKGTVIMTILPTGVTSGTYGSATYIPRFEVGADGRLIAVTNVAISATGGGSTGSALSANASRYSGARWAALGTSITSGMGAAYTASLVTLSGMALTNLGVSGGSLSSSSSQGASAIMNAIANIPTNSQVVTLEGFPNDFRGNAALGTFGDTSPATFYGALWTACGSIITRCPSAQVFMLTEYGNTDNGFLGKWNVANNNGVFMSAFVKAQKDVADAFGIATIDVGSKSGIGGPTASLYLGDGIHLNQAGAYRYADYVWTQMQLYNITTTTPAPTASTPTISPASGSYTASQTITLACATTGATIYYTVDGSTPTVSSPAYTAPFSVTLPTTVKAFAVASGFNGSFVATSTYAPNTDGLNLATLSDLSGVGLTVNSVNANGTISYTETGGFSYASLFLANAPNNFVEFETNTMPAGGFWLTLGQGASGIVGVGSDGTGNTTITQTGRFEIANMAVTSGGAPTPASATFVAAAVGQKYRIKRIGTVVTVYQLAGTTWNTILTIDLTSQSVYSSSAYYSTIRLGILVNGGLFMTIKNVRVGVATS